MVTNHKYDCMSLSSLAVVWEDDRGYLEYQITITVTSSHASWKWYQLLYCPGHSGYYINSRSNRNRKFVGQRLIRSSLWGNVVLACLVRSLFLDSSTMADQCNAGLRGAHSGLIYHFLLDVMVLFSGITNVYELIPQLYVNLSVGYILQLQRMHGFCPTHFESDTKQSPFRQELQSNLW